MPRFYHFLRWTPFIRNVEVSVWQARNSLSGLQDYNIWYRPIASPRPPLWNIIRADRSRAHLSATRDLLRALVG